MLLAPTTQNRIWTVHTEAVTVSWYFEVCATQAHLRSGQAGQGIWFVTLLHFLHVMQVNKPTQAAMQFSHGSGFFDLHNVQQKMMPVATAHAIQIG